MMASEITLQDAWNKCCDQWAPIKLYWNGELIWDDDVDFEEWINPANAITIFENEHGVIRHKMVYKIEIEIVDFHHSIVRMYGESAEEHK